MILMKVTWICILNNLFRKLIKDTFQDEIADSLFAFFDLCGGLQIDIEKHIKYKLRITIQKREFKHGKQGIKAVC